MWRSVIVILFSLGTVLAHNPTAKTTFGLYEGTWTETQSDLLIASYPGIPYAKPPLGERRFKKPERWTNKRKTTRFGTFRGPCIAFKGLEEGREDCLYLNVFTKHVIRNPRKFKNSDRSPVMVFLISDSYGNNNNSFYTPEYLLKHDVVLVTVNYRLGYFGFFTTGDEVAPGNAGLKDVLEALYWIQNNIAAFGGDPNSVTLMGQGAGAGVAHLLALSEKSEGLFHKYVTHSGSALMPWSYRPRAKARSTSLAFATSVNCTGKSKEIVDCLQELEDYINGDNSTEIVTPWSNYGPTDEPESDEAVITRHPAILIKEGKARDIPWLTGVVANEGQLIDFTKFYDENSTLCEALEKRFEDIVFAIADYRDSVRDSHDFVEKLISFYFDGIITENCTSYFIKLAEDISMNWPVFDGVISQAEKIKSPIYFYNFAYNGTFTTFGDLSENERLVISHGNDINYLFPVLDYVFEDWQMKNTGLDITMINIVGDMWTSFATTGIPKASLTQDWTPYQEAEGYMEFGPGAQLSVKNHFLEERMNFWLNLTKDLIKEPEELDEASPVGSGWSIAGSYSISKSLLYFLAQFVILAIFNNW